MSAAPPSPATVFDRVADSYDNVGIPWFQPIAAGLVRELDPRRGHRVLDVGCGRGAALLPLAEAVGPRGSVLGIDLAPRMVELTAADTAHLPHVEVRLADAAEPGLPDGTFDLVSACLVAFFMPDPQAAVRAWSALLRPRGRLGLATFGRQDPFWVEIDALFSPYLPPGLLDARTSGRTGPFGSDDGVASLLLDAGLSRVRTTHATVEVTLPDVATWERLSRSHGQRAMWDAVPADDQPAVRERVAEMLAARGGKVTVAQQVRYTLGERS